MGGRTHGGAGRPRLWHHAARPGRHGVRTFGGRGGRTLRGVLRPPAALGAFSRGRVGAGDVLAPVERLAFGHGRPGRSLGRVLLDGSAFHRSPPRGHRAEDRCLVAPLGGAAAPRAPAGGDSRAARGRAGRLSARRAGRGVRAAACRGGARRGPAFARGARGIQPRGAGARPARLTARYRVAERAHRHRHCAGVAPRRGRDARSLAAALPFGRGPAPA